MNSVEKLINEYVNEHLDKDLVSANVLKSVTSVKSDDVDVDILFEFGFPILHYSEKIKKFYQEKIFEKLNKRAEIVCTSKIVTHKVQPNVKPLKNIKNIIVVSSAKGGVGKSTTAINLALSLRHEGASVGILDADIYGPSLPKMVGSLQKPESIDGNSMEPIEVFGLQTMSIGYIIDQKDPAIWRSPIAVQALLQLLNETNWKNLDYLIIDMPPGTGDIQLTLAQKIPVSGAVIITTPQDLSMLDARKGLNMFKKLDIPILGIVENMSTHICSKCGHEENIFGADGGKNLSIESGIRLLAKIPLDIDIRKDIDDSKPTVFNDPKSEVSIKYRNMALTIAAELSLKQKDYSSKFPKIVVNAVNAVNAVDK